MAQIPPAGHRLRRDITGNGLRLLDHLRRKRFRNPGITQQTVHIDARRVHGTQILQNGAGQRLVRIVPLVKPNQHFVILGNVLRFGDTHIVIETGRIGNDIRIVGGMLQHAHHPVSGALQYLHHPAFRTQVALTAPLMFPGRVLRVKDFNGHLVAGQGNTAIAVGDVDL